MQYMFEHKGKWIEQFNEDFEPTIIKDKTGKFIINPKAKLTNDNRNFEALTKKVLQGTQAMKKLASISTSGYSIILYANAYYNKSDLNEVQKRLDTKAKAFLINSNTAIELRYYK